MAQPAPDPKDVINSDLSVSDKIRRLHEAGYSRSRIADAIGRSYQQVRQVLVEDERRARRRTSDAMSEPALSEVREPGAVFAGVYRLEVEPGGVVRLPTEVLAALGGRAGGVLVGELEADRFVILSGRAAAMKARALVQGLGDASRVLSEELIAERRAEAEREG